MHGRLRRVSLLVLTVLQLEACVRKHILPPEDYGITETITKQRDGGSIEPVAVNK